jgi:hypothetical protein
MIISFGFNNFEKKKKDEKQRVKIKGKTKCGRCVHSKKL